MTIKTGNTPARIRKIFGWCLSVWTLVVAVALIVQVWRILSLGDNAFTAATIGRYFMQISAPVCIWVAAVIAGGVLSLAFPSEKEKPTAYISEGVTLKKLSRRLPVNEEGRYALNEIYKQRNARIVVWCVCAVCCVVAAVFCLILLLGEYTVRSDAEFFQSHLEAERLLKTLPWLSAAFAVCVGAVLFDRRSRKQTIVDVKAEIAENAKKGVKATGTEEKTCIWERIPFLKDKHFKTGVRVALAVLAVVLIVVGIDNGGMTETFKKAVEICKQCIGIA